MNENITGTGCEDIPTYNYQFEIVMPDGIYIPIGEQMALVDPVGTRTIVNILGHRVNEEGKNILLVKRDVD